MLRPTLRQHLAWRKWFEDCDGLGDLDATMAHFAQAIIAGGYEAYTKHEGDEGD